MLPQNEYAVKNNKVLLIAHRGGSREYLENTIEAFDNAYRLNANIIEMDLCLTKDKKIVVIHDSHLKRMTGVNKHVEEFNYNELPQIKDEVLIDFTIHKKFQTDLSTHRYFPLFEDVLKKYPNAIFNVEIKTPTDEFLQLLNNLIVKYDKSESIVWGCRPPEYNKKIYKVNPKVQRWFNESIVFKTYFLFMIGLLPFVDLKENSFQVPLYTTDFHLWKKKEAKTLRQQIYVFIMFKLVYLWTVLGGFIVYHLKQRGIVTYYWVLNSIYEFNHAVKLGANGIMTDSPTTLKQFLISKDLYVDNNLFKQKKND
ncbi:PLC-like phosphodiesterase, TIM beta/alpha-barrel domain [Pseudocohnilembus persalinus]|uniref:PLC-like phosphodiesterase, TIM beta/alpha-barrel domain n=1 Tax=Pseudocohnilembus persalinus TaxID=266149 RepID=A0A0V0QHS5_PSEPJ|nr:PLC-like phosphodiesterase, TIM beta/alpha-barrel domain [Pseudocohnilembus persalinus]|eukprot:KRX01742.1 PLC-like phosphodiesterase, TIM beta/alpha-barrel domain [Pseudocohnilembus persalinus]